MINEEEVIKCFKKKFESMTYEERQEYLDRYGFTFEEKEEVKHGHWIPLENNEFQCSECRNRVVSFNPSIDVTKDLHYCWNCGAKMEFEKVQK